MMGTSEPSQGVQEVSAPGQALLRPFPLVGLSNPQQRARRWPWGDGPWGPGCSGTEQCSNFRKGLGSGSHPAFFPIHNSQGPPEWGTQRPRIAWLLFGFDSATERAAKGIFAFQSGSRISELRLRGTDLYCYRCLTSDMRGAQRG